MGILKGLSLQQDPAEVFFITVYLPGSSGGNTECLVRKTAEREYL